MCVPLGNPTFQKLLRQLMAEAGSGGAAQPGVQHASGSASGSGSGGGSGQGSAAEEWGVGWAQRDTFAVFQALAVIMARVEIDEAVQCLLPKLISVFLSVLDPSRRSGVCPLRICASLGQLVAVFDATLRAVLAARQTRKRRGNTAWRQTSSHSNLQSALMTSAAQLGACCNAPGLVREQGGWRKRQHCS